MLFHGTGKTDPSLILKSEEGFDMRNAVHGNWGRGLYFSESAELAGRYAYSNPLQSEVKEIFLASVLIGYSFKSKPDKSLRMPPVNPTTREKSDSVCGNNFNTTSYVIYDNGRSYPTYLIKYTLR